MLCFLQESVGFNSPFIESKILLIHSNVSMCSAFVRCAVGCAVLTEAFTVLQLFLAPTLTLLCVYDSRKFVCIFKKN